MNVINNSGSKNKIVSANQQPSHLLQNEQMSVKDTNALVDSMLVDPSKGNFIIFLTFLLLFIFFPVKRMIKRKVLITYKEILIP